MNPRLDDTIVAIASPAGPAERGIVRIGGPDVLQVVGKLLPLSENDRDETRARRIRGQLDAGGVPLPTSLYLWPTRRSYIGQPLAELHVVGSPPLVDLVVSLACENGARPARRGEFTLRAFLGGRVDLVQAEAVLGVIDADDHVELERALVQLAGGVSSRMHVVRGDLLDLLADLEAGLDFVDEDIEFVENDDVVRRLVTARESVERLVERAAERNRSGGRPVVVLAGPPNAGKSTLFNRLVDGGTALVSETAGTTRDYLVGEVDCLGLPVDLVDTAGWEWQTDAISAEAQRLRHEQLDRADLVVWCTPAGQGGEPPDDGRLANDVSGEALRLGTMRDRGHVADTDLCIDARSDDLTPVVEAIASRLSTGAGDRGELLASTAARCRDGLVRAAESLGRAAEAADQRMGDEFVALEVRAALEDLGAFLGEVYTDDVLDRIFSRFCIGK